ncbi:hypothetical protein G9A89_003380 [Geosiphon pyriformis]|nr:hypothetical protein G9A89_003380 [Geosiphon pyriformis]
MSNIDFSPFSQKPGEISPIKNAVSSMHFKKWPLVDDAISNVVIDFRNQSFFIGLIPGYTMIFKDDHFEDYRMPYAIRCAYLSMGFVQSSRTLKLYYLNAAQIA